MTRVQETSTKSNLFVVNACITVLPSLYPSHQEPDAQSIVTGMTLI